MADLRVSINHAIDECDNLEERIINIHDAKESKDIDNVLKLEDENTTEISPIIENGYNDDDNSTERSALIDTNRQLDFSLQEAENKLYILNKRLVDHFKRKKVFTAITSNKEDVETDELKFKQIFLVKLTEFEHSLNDSNQTCDYYLAEIENSAQIKNNFELDNNKKCAELYKDIFNVGKLVKHSKTGKYLDENFLKSQLKNIQITREILSQQRLQMIKLNEKLATVTAQSNALDDFGDGLKLADFDKIQRENQSLTDKIQERTNETLKLRKRCFSDTQILAHVREKNHLLRWDIEKNKEILRIMNTEMQNERRKLNEFKAKLNKIRGAYAKVSESCGLLEQPLLLREYDKLVNTIHEHGLQISNIEIENAGLREKISRYDERIALLTK